MNLENMWSVISLKMDCSWKVTQQASSNLKSTIKSLDKVKKIKTKLIIKTAVYLLDTGNKMNVHKSFRRHPGLLVNIL